MSDPASLPETNPLRQALPRTQVPEPCAVVLFGATGDLAHRKLVPALFQLAQGGNLPSECAIVGFARRDWTDDDLRAEYEKTPGQGGRRPRFPRGLGPVRQPAGLRRRGPSTTRAGYRRLKETLEELDRTHGTRGNRVFYLAVAPEFFATIIGHLGEAGLIYPWQQASPWSRVVIEKPFGHDLESALALNLEVSHVLDESQVYRIDHYLGKETVQNILALRFGNTHLRADLGPPVCALGAGDGGRGGRHGRRPGCVLRHRRHDPRHGAEPHDAAPLAWWRWSRR